MTDNDKPFPMKDGQIFCGPHPIKDLAETYGTPLYLYDFDFVRRRIRTFQEAFSGVSLLLAYSVKANGNLAILNRLASLGVGADIVSGGELFRARKAGMEAGKIVFAGVGKTDEELKAGLDGRIYSFNVETVGELHRLEEMARERDGRAPFGIRVNPDIHSPTPHEYTRTGHAETKFGIPVPVAVGLYRWAATRPHLNIKGIDVHIGSQIVEPKPYRKALRSVLEIVHLLKKEGIHLKYLDLGGGFGVPYEGDEMDIGVLAEAVVPLMKGSGLKLILEPGRSVIGEAGSLVTRVLSVKKSGEKTFVITDAGMTELIRPSHYGGFHPVRPVEDVPGREAQRVDVVGPICESGDFLARDRELPLPRPGDLLSVGIAGAYGFTMASNYNARPRPPEVMVDQGEVHLIRERETYEDLVRGEAIP
ncbi:MAG: diaminopimelate decarboxylase [Longimicrobiales bacterium]